MNEIQSVILSALTTSYAIQLRPASIAIEPERVEIALDVINEYVMGMEALPADVAKRCDDSQLAMTL